MTATYSAPNTVVADLPLDLVERSDLNPRRHFDPEGLDALAESIRQHGVMQPIVVRSALKPGDNRLFPKYLIVAGERRWRAARLAGLATIPAVVREGLTDEDHLRLALNVFPAVAVDNPLDGRMMQAVLASDGAGRHAVGAQSPDVPNGIVGELRTGMGFALETDTRGPLLPHHVGAVVLWGSEFEVIGPNAPRMIAGMADDHSVGNRAVDEFPRDPMRQQELALSSTRSDSSVAGAVGRASPPPASVALFDIAPEALFERNSCVGALWQDAQVMELHEPTSRSRNLAAAAFAKGVRCGCR